jgi:hypothetical protein
MTILRLPDDIADDFSKQPEVLPGIQMGLWRRKRRCLIVGDLVVLIFDKSLRDEFESFYASTWGRDAGASARNIEQAYRSWLRELEETGEVEPVRSSRREISRLVSEYTYDDPPPDTDNGDRPAPPDRSDLDRNRSDERPQGLPDQYGHLPFKSLTKEREVFYRWESWPDSRRVLQNEKRIKPQTFAAPQSEVPFAPTGFGAVARFALPSFFPHVFRWEIQPDAGTTIFCGAVVPMFGQSGGGVEVYFVDGAHNRGPIANPVVLPTM